MGSGCLAEHFSSVALTQCPSRVFVYCGNPLQQSTIKKPPTQTDKVFAGYAANLL